MLPRRDLEKPTKRITIGSLWTHCVPVPKRRALSVIMSSNTDRRLLSAIVDYLQSRREESANPALLDESIRLLQLLYRALLTHRLSFNMNAMNESSANTNLYSIFDNVLFTALR